MPGLIDLIRVEPTGEFRGPAFVEAESGSGLQIVCSPIYPKSENGEAARRARISMGVGIREAAEALRITSGGYSGLETGRFTLSQEHWEKAMEILRTKAAVKP